MSYRFLRLGALIVLATAAFSTARVIRSGRPNRARSTLALADKSDSAELASIGASSGRQLVAYVFVSSKCGYCRAKDVKEAIRGLRALLLTRYRSEFRRISVVGVAIDDKTADGFGYLHDIGSESFDEIDVGGGWQNEHAVNKIWRDHDSEALVPQILIVSRRLNATWKPFDLQFAADSALHSIRGRAELLRWVQQNAPLNYVTRTESASTPGASRPTAVSP